MKDINKIKKQLKSEFKRYVLYYPYTINISEHIYTIIKESDNKFNVICGKEDLLIDLYDYKTYTLHNLINLLVIEIEKEPIS